MVHPYYRRINIILNKNILYIIILFCIICSTIQCNPLVVIWCAFNYVLILCTLLDSLNIPDTERVKSYRLTMALSIYI